MGLVKEIVEDQRLSGISITQNRCRNHATISICPFRSINWIYGDFECYILQYLQCRVTHLAAWHVARYMKLLGASTTTSGNHLLFFEDTNFVLSLLVTSIAARHLLGALCQDQHRGRIKMASRLFQVGMTFFLVVYVYYICIILCIGHIPAVFLRSVFALSAVTFRGS